MKEEEKTVMDIQREERHSFIPPFIYPLDTSEVVTCDKYQSVMFTVVQSR